MKKPLLPAAPRGAALLIAVLLLAALAAPAGALMVKVPLPDLAQRADQILRCRVTHLQSRWNDDHTAIVTDVTLAVSEPWKGTAAAGSTVTMTVRGGVVGDVGMKSEHAPAFEPGEEVVLFLWQLDGALCVTAEEQGKYTVVGDWVVGCEHQPVKLADFRAELARYLPSEGR